MYEMLNGSLPFVTTTVNENKAFEIRMTGKTFSNIQGLDQGLMNIITKASSFNNKERYKNATKMKQDLEKLPQILSKKKVLIFQKLKKQLVFMKKIILSI